MIWVEAIEPRFITVDSRDNMFTLVATYKPAPLLSTSFESRQVALKHYTLSLGYHREGPVYFSPKHDILLFVNYLNFHHFARKYTYGYKEFQRDVQSKVRNLAFSGDDDLWTSNISLLQDWTSLNKIFLVARNRAAPRRYFGQSYRTSSPSSLYQQQNDISQFSTPAHALKSCMTQTKF